MLILQNISKNFTSLREICEHDHANILEVMLF